MSKKYKTVVIATVIEEQIPKKLFKALGQLNFYLEEINYPIDGILLTYAREGRRMSEKSAKKLSNLVKDYPYTRLSMFVKEITPGRVPS